MDSKASIPTVEQATQEINLGVLNMVNQALTRELASAKVRIATLEAEVRELQAERPDA